MQNDFNVIMIFGVFFVGCLLAIVYYFARFYFRDGTPQEPEQLDTFKPSPLLSDKTEKIPVLVQPKEVEATLTEALSKTRSQWFGRLQSLFTTGAEKKQIIEAVEEILYTADVGAETAHYFIDKIEKDWSGAKEDMFALLEKQILELIGNRTFEPQQWLNATKTHKPQVWMVVGVNGAGKTTSIGKLAHQAKAHGLKVLVAAADTFRAAAQDQLKVWVERSGADFHSPPNVTDPAAVAFSALERAKNQNYDLLIVDTAGRLHTQKNLMEELKKIQRSLHKLDPSAPQQTIAVLDANSGQNALIQAKEFNSALNLSAVILTKMDGTAKGGVILGVSHTLKIPTVYVGIGEKIHDLKPFNPVEYTNALVRP